MTDAISAPETAFAIFKLGQWITRRVRVYRNAPTLVKEVQELGLDLHKRDFYRDIKLAESLSIDTNDADLQSDVGLRLRRIKTGLDDTQRLLGKALNDKGKLDRAKFTLFVEEELKERLSELRGWQSEYYEFVKINELLQRGRENLSLSHQRFMPSTLPDGSYCDRIPGTNHAYFGRAEWRDQQRGIQYSPVLFEKHELGLRSREQVVEMLLYLSMHLPRSPVAFSGILRCLGYRDLPTPELIFEISAAYSEPRALRRILSECSDGTEELSKATRVLLASRIATAVLNAQKIGLVHKDIRPDNILVSKDASTTWGIGEQQFVPFLTNWTLARKEQDLSYRRGDDDWTNNLYRHPQRQGLHVQERYHAGHDIYSLGVCLLEIGLGESLIVIDDDDVPRLCQLFRKEAYHSGFVDAAIDVCEKLKPTQNAATLVSLCQRELLSRMGRDYSTIVQRCLECVENGFGSIKDFQEQTKEVKSVFQASVVTPLDTLKSQSEATLI